LPRGCPPLCRARSCILSSFSSCSSRPGSYSLRAGEWWAGQRGRFLLPPWSLLRYGPIQNFPSVRNPFGGPPFVEWVEAAGGVLGPACFVAAIVSLILRGQRHGRSVDELGKRGHPTRCTSNMERSCGRGRSSGYGAGHSEAERTHDAVHIGSVSRVVGLEADRPLAPDFSDPAGSCEQTLRRWRYSTTYREAPDG
jgi:hypothetical protein